MNKCQGQEVKSVSKQVHPLSITSGMSREELQTIFRQRTILVFLFVDLKDHNTAPTSRNGTVAWLLQQIGFTNWRTFA
jgi:hypothetical protein